MHYHMYIHINIYLSISHVIQITPQQQSAEPRNSAGAEALAVARRPKEASRNYLTSLSIRCLGVEGAAQGGIKGRAADRIARIFKIQYYVCL